MSKRIERVEDLTQDLAARHRSSASGADARDAASDADFAALERDGYVVIESLLAPERCEEIREETRRLLGATGRNAFEGLTTQRVYNALAKTRVLDDLVDHPRVVALLDRLFLPNYLLSQAQLIHILPGEQAQLLHADDAFYRVPRPRPPLGAATIWAIDEFTPYNGATVVVPGSHRWDEERRPMPAEAIPCVMPAGSVVVFLGTLWHGGGANRSDKPRLAATCQYCEPWLRQQENFSLGVPREVARGLRESLLRMLGYSIYPPFMGMVDGMHPKRLLDRD
jgi:ectoine hydroxylase-related dioxygenase (phytanoyl-CoA dioxygenase family)